MPVVQHLLHSLGERKVVAKLDLAQAYKQLPMDKATAEARYNSDSSRSLLMLQTRVWSKRGTRAFSEPNGTPIVRHSGIVPYFDNVLASSANKTELLD